MHILLAEDDVLLGDGLKAGLIQLGFSVEWVKDGVAALRALRSNDYTAAVLDLGLPRKDGLNVLATLRQEGNTTPVLVLTARDTIPDRVLGLDTGADRYVVKPVDLVELAARLRALVRYPRDHATERMVVQDVVLDPGARTVSHRGIGVALAAREFGLLRILMENANQVLSREQLEHQLYGDDEALDSNSIEVHIHNLRRKLGPELIHTVRGVGYMFLREAAQL